METSEKVSLVNDTETRSWKSNSERVYLSTEIKATSRKSKPVEFKGDVTQPDVMRFLYRTNGYVKRGVDTTVNAILRSGYEIIPATSRDQKIIDKFTYENNFEELMYDTAFNAVMHGYQGWELFDDKEKGIMAALIPIDEMDYQRDAQGTVLFDKYGKPKGYVQKRDGKDIGKWDRQFIPHFFLNRTMPTELGTSMLEPVILPAKEIGYIRNNIGDSFIRSLPVVHMIVEGGTGEDIEDVSNSLGTQFTAETVYVTSERYQINTESTTSYNIEIFNFTEPLISEIASCFQMPVELLAPTKHMKSDDFPERYIEWIEVIKGMQRKFANTLERDVFNLMTKKPVEVKFNNPAAISPDTMLNRIGFAKQSEAIDEEKAREMVEQLI